jgi:hypothetical protein
MRTTLFCFILSLATSMPSLAQDLKPSEMSHLDVYKESGRFAGWPANHGIWSWGDEIVVGFERGYFFDNTGIHDIDYSKPAQHMLARSKDGGDTWTIEQPPGLQPPANTKVANVLTGPDGPELRDCEGGYDFSNPDFVMTFRMTSHQHGPSHYYVSNDRAKTWDGPCNLPDFGQPGIAARTDYIINGPKDMTVFLTAAKRNRLEGRVITVRTLDGGASWDFQSYIGPEPLDYSIMPSSVRLSPASILTAVRRRNWIDVYRSDNNGESWSLVNQAATDIGGNPPSMVRLADGRIVITYGYRKEPYSIRARVSDDEGLTWSPPIILRADGGGRDLGYTRTVLRPDGKLVTVYYFNVDAARERFIAATIWDVDSVH